MAARHRLSRVRRLGRPEAFLPWVPMLVGVAIMAGYVIYALMLRVGYQPADPDGFEMVVPPKVATAPAAPTTSGPAPQPTDRADPDQDPEQPSEPPPPPVTEPAPEPPEPPEPPPKPPPGLTGEYGIDETFDDVFIGKVTIANDTNRAQDWTVELAFPDNVGTLNTFWVDGTPQPTLRDEGDLYIFTSTVQVEERSEVILKFHFDRSGADVPPGTCTVNGISCAVG